MQRTQDTTHITISATFTMSTASRGEQGAAVKLVVSPEARAALEQLVVDIIYHTYANMPEPTVARIIVVALLTSCAQICVRFTGEEVARLSQTICELLHEYGENYEATNEQAAEKIIAHFLEVTETHHTGSVEIRKQSSSAH